MSATARRVLYLVLAAWLALVPGGLAQAQTATQRLYAEGAFLQAAAAGEASSSASGYALAARALLARCMLAGNDQDEMVWIERARRNAESALAREPQSVEARLQLATALGMRAQRLSIPQALREGLAGQGRRLIDEALARAPNDPWANALSGGWHLEVLRRGGPVGAMTMGARLQDGIAAFDRALQLAPNDPAILMQYAGGLLLLDARRHQDLIEALLRRAEVAPARDAFERFAVTQAGDVRLILDTQGPRAASRAVAALL
jgi:tetratricopeptide (TPR) repeat protein